MLSPTERVGRAAEVFARLAGHSQLASVEARRVEKVLPAFFVALEIVEKAGQRSAMESK